jgi:hypothetical protein
MLNIELRSATIESGSPPTYRRETERSRNGSGKNVFTPRFSEKILNQRVAMETQRINMGPSHKFRSRSSSVSIVSDYGLDNREIEVRSPAGAKDFSSNICAQAGSEAHPASCTMDTGGPFRRAKRGRGVTLTTHPHLVPRSGMSRSYTSSPPKCLRGV